MPPVNAFAPGSYVKRGFLMKLEVTQRPLGVHKKWLRRFCILTHSKLFVYEHEVKIFHQILTKLGNITLILTAQTFSHYRCTYVLFMPDN